MCIYTCHWEVIIHKRHGIHPSYELSEIISLLPRTARLCRANVCINTAEPRIHWLSLLGRIPYLRLLCRTRYSTFIYIYILALGKKESGSGFACTVRRGSALALISSAPVCKTLQIALFHILFVWKTRAVSKIPLRLSCETLRRRGLGAFLRLCMRVCTYTTRIQS